jgi:hypothetical protein
VAQILSLNQHGEQTRRRQWLAPSLAHSPPPCHRRPWPPAASCLALCADLMGGGTDPVMEAPDPPDPPGWASSSKEKRTGKPRSTSVPNAGKGSGGQARERESTLTCAAAGQEPASGQLARGQGRRAHARSCCLRARGGRAARRGRVRAPPRALTGGRAAASHRACLPAPTPNAALAPPPGPTHARAPPCRGLPSPGRCAHAGVQLCPLAACKVQMARGGVNSLFKNL